MQPLLMLKQTLEATYDPGALLLNGPNVRFTSSDQIFSRLPGRATSDTFSIGIGVDSQQSVELIFKKIPKKGIDLFEEVYSRDSAMWAIRSNMSQEEILLAIPSHLSKLYSDVSNEHNTKYDWIIERKRCFLSLRLVSRGELKESSLSFLPDVIALGAYPSTQDFSLHLQNIIHVPGLRGNPERTYKTTAIGSTFPGTFEDYVASVINQWQATKDARLARLGSALETLGLTWRVEAKQIDDTQVELHVARMIHGARGRTKEKDTVNIADVGFGVSQTLPVLVALLVAEPGQLVYIEQPEIHLHPRAQGALAHELVATAKRGVRVVIETHSSLLLRGIQTQVASDQISPDLIGLHWFTRRPEDGSTNIHTATLDDAGAFGDWPEDFDDVSLRSEQAYLDAAEAKLFRNG